MPENTRLFILLYLHIAKLFLICVPPREEQHKEIKPMLMTYDQSALTAQASWYVYSSMKISKTEFESQRFRTMLQRSNRGDNTACLSRQQLILWVRAEFSVFLIYLKEIIAECFELSLGNPFAQALHDGGTLENKQKFQVFGLQFIAPDFESNIVVMVGLIPFSDGEDEAVASLLTKVTEERTRLPLSSMVASVMQDRATKGVACELELDVEVCGIHDTDKLGRPATGQLVRSKNKQTVNPFLE